MILVPSSLSFPASLIISDSLRMLFVIKITVLGTSLRSPARPKILGRVFCFSFHWHWVRTRASENIRTDKSKIVYMKSRRMHHQNFITRDVYFFFLTWILFKDVTWKVKYEMSCIKGPVTPGCVHTELSRRYKIS